MQTKAWYKSKTIWTNVIAFAATVAGVFGLDIGPDLQAEIVTGVLAVVNVALRLITAAPVGTRDAGS